MTTTKHEGKCCDECFKDKGLMVLCKDESCPCHEPTGAGMRNWERELEEQWLYKGMTLADVKVFVEARLAKAYHSGHTAGQAAEREKTRVLVKGLQKKVKPVYRLADRHIGQSIEDTGYNKALDDVSSSLNKD